MKIKYFYLLYKFYYERNIENLQKILDLFNIKMTLPENIDELDFHMNAFYVEIFDNNTNSLYEVVFEGKSYSIIHIFSNYTIKKDYHYEESEPYNKEITINRIDETLYYSDIKTDKEKIKTLRRIKKDKNGNKILFEKQSSSLTYEPNYFVVKTKTDDGKRHYSMIRQKDPFYFSMSSLKEITETKDNIETEEKVEMFFIDRPLDSEDINNLNNNDSFTYHCLKLGLPVLKIRTNYTSESFITTLVAKKKHGKIIIELYRYVNGVETKVDEISVDSKAKKKFTEDDIDMIINIVSQIEKPNSIIMTELKIVKKEFMKNLLYGKAIGDNIDLYFEELESDNFEKIAYDIFNSADNISKDIHSVITTTNKNISLELKRQ